MSCLLPLLVEWSAADSGSATSETRSAKPGSTGIGCHQKRPRAVAERFQSMRHGPKRETPTWSCFGSRMALMKLAPGARAARVRRNTDDRITRPLAISKRGRRHPLVVEHAAPREVRRIARHCLPEISRADMETRGAVPFFKQHKLEGGGWGRVYSRAPRKTVSSR